MAKVPEFQQDLYEQELQSGAAASEDTMQKVAGSVNFWNARFQSGRPWVLNGRIDILPFPVVGVDQGLFAPVNLRVFGFGMMLNVPGSAGELEIDLIVHPANLALPSYSLFSQRPKIQFSAGAYARMGYVYNALNVETALVESAGITKPIFDSFTLNAGDFVTLNLINAPTAAESATISLETRPR